MVVMEIVFTGPEEFDGHADLLGNGTGFEHVVVGEATAETASRTPEMDSDIGRGDVEDLGDELAAVFGSLRWRPEFEFPVVIVCEAILRLEGSVGEEWIVVGGGDAFGGGFESGGGIAIFAKSHRGSLLREFLGVVEEAFAALLRGGTFLPSDCEFLTRGIGLPPGVGDDRDAAVESEKIGSAGESKNVADAGLFLDVFEIGGSDFAGENGTFFVDGPEHVGDAIVDGVERFAGDDGEVVHTSGGVADDFVVFGVFEGDGFELGRSESGNSGSERTVGGGTIGCGVKDAAGRSGAFGFRDGPGLRGGDDEHLAAGGTDATEGIPVDGSGGATSGALRAVLRFVEIGLHDADIFPIDVKFFGDKHGEHGFDALADFRIFGGDGEEVVGGDADEGGGDVVLGGRGSLREEIFERISI